MNTAAVRGFFAFFLSSLLTLPGMAADRAFVGKLAIAVSEDGVKRLGLSAETKQKLLDLIDKREQQALSLALELKDLPPEQRESRLAPFVAESEKQGLALLTIEQREKLDQLRIAQDGMGSLREPDISKVLGLSEDQRKKIDELMAERQQALTRGGENDRRVVRSEFERKLATVLTEEQRANWEKLAGLSEGETQKAEATAVADQPAPAKPVVATPTKTEVAEKPATAPTAEPQQFVGEPARREDGEVLLKFNFQHAPWKDVLEWFAEQSDLSLNMEVVPTGTCNYRDKRSFTPAEGIDLMNSMLLTKGFTLVRHERLLTVLNLEDPIPPQLVELIPLSELNERGDFELVKCLFPLSKMETTEAEAEIAKLIGPQGSIVSLPKSRQLLVTETAGKLRTIREVISAVENPESNQLESIRVVSLKNIDVEAFLVIARPLLGLPEGQNQSIEIRLALDPFSPRIFATGIPAALKRLDEIIAAADRQIPVDVDGPAAKPLEQVQIETYPIGKADPVTVLQVMQTLLAGLPEVRLTVDPVNNKLIALARPTEHRTIIETLKQLEGLAPGFEVIQLRKTDPQSAVLLINKMFGAANEKDKTASDAPKVDGDPNTMKLFVRGTREQIEQIKDVVEKMEGPLPSEDLASRQTLRFLPLSGAAARSTLENIEPYWQTMRSNKIRVVTPSAISPTLRQQSSGGTGTIDSTQPSLGIPPGLAPPPGGRFIPREPVPPAAQPAPSTEPAPSAPSPQPSKDEARRLRLHSNVQFVSFGADEDPPTEAAAPAQSDKTSTPDGQSASDAPPRAPSKEPDAEKASGEKPDIIVTVTPQGIFYASKDLDALDEYEKLLRTFVEARGSAASGEPTVFWLKYSKADVTAELLNQVLNGVGADSGGGGSLLGDMASSMLGDAGGLLGGLLGGGSGGGASSVIGSTTIVPDIRLNCLIVQGRPQDLSLIDQLLPIIDREASPEEILTTGKPHLIPVIYNSAEEMANIVRQVFADRVAGAGGGGNQQRQPSPEEFINALRGRSGGRQNQAKGEVAKMTVGVDPRSNSLIVAAPEPLFREVELLVRQLDQEGSSTEDSYSVVAIRQVNPVLLQKALNSLTGGQVKVNTQSAGTTSTPGQSQTGGQSSQPQPQSGPSADDIRRRMEFFQNLQRGGGDSGRSRSFGSPGGGFPPFGFGGDRGGGDRGGGDRGGDRGGRGGRD